VGEIIHEATQRRKLASTVTCDTSKFSAALAGRKYRNRQSRHSFKGRPTDLEAPFKRMPACRLQYLRPAKAAENFNVPLVTAEATFRR